MTTVAPLLSVPDDANGQRQVALSHAGRFVPFVGRPIGQETINKDDLSWPSSVFLGSHETASCFMVLVFEA
jgi:hypothetical protein